MIDNLAEKAYIELTKAGVNVEKTIQAVNNMNLKGKIDSEEVGPICFAAGGGLLLGGLMAAAGLGNRQERGENVAGQKVLYYVGTPVVTSSLAIIDALQD